MKTNDISAIPIGLALGRIIIICAAVVGLAGSENAMSRKSDSSKPVFGKSGVETVTRLARE